MFVGMIFILLLLQLFHQIITIIKSKFCMHNYYVVVNIYVKRRCDCIYTEMLIILIYFPLITSIYFDAIQREMLS